MTRIARPLLAPRTGAATIEYAIVAALVTVAVIGVLWQFGPKLLTRWGIIESKLDQADTVVVIDAPPPKPEKP